MIRRVALGLLLVAMTAGCGGDPAEEPASSLSRSQRDSVLADSPLPGAATVGRALDLADSARTRAAKLDERNRN